MKKGIDVSVYQGEVDWERVKEYIDFAIIRCGYGENIDRYFYRNINECRRLKIPVGVYLYGMARNVEEAYKEAEFTLELVKNYHLEYPIFYDVYEGRTDLSKNEITNIVNAYCERIENDRYYVGIYASAYRFRNLLNSIRLDKYDRWVAEWSPRLEIRNDVGMWQNTSHEDLPGIDSRVDGDVALIDYPKIIRDAGLNHLDRDECFCNERV